MAAAKAKKRGWGGARAGAGRPPKPGAVKHDVRPPFRKDRPVHITVRTMKGVPPLTGQLPRTVIRAALELSAERAKEDDDFNVLHHAIEADRLQFIVEATSKRALTSGVMGLLIRIARQMNKSLGREGKVWSERYVRQDLTTASELKSAVARLRGSPRPRS
jgi:hypothetical protein